MSRPADRACGRGALPCVEQLEGRLQLSGAVPGTTYTRESTTYLGGAAADEPKDIATDSSGNVYVVGHTFSADFPTTAGPFASYHDAGDAFVAKFNSNGTRTWTYDLGGAGYENAHAVALDGLGNLWVVGETESTDFPATSPIQASNAGAYDIFILKFNLAGQLVFSTYLGGTGTDAIRDLAIAADDSVWIAGDSYSPSFPAAQGGTLLGNPNVGPFVLQLSNDGTRIVAAMRTLVSSAMAIGPGGDIYLVGPSPGDGLASPNGYIQHPQGAKDMFVVRMTPLGTTVFATYLGTDTDDEAKAIAVDSAGNAIIAAQIGAVGNGAPYMNGDAMIWKLAADGASLVYRTPIGGSALDYADAVVAGEHNTAYVTGRTFAGSEGFPLANAFQSQRGGGDEAFFAKLGADGTIMTVSYLGGNGSDAGAAIAVDPATRTTFLAGITESTDLATPGAFQGTPGGGSDVFTAKLVRPAATPQVIITESNGSTAVTEGRTADGYTLVLTAKPTANVTVTATAGSQLAIYPASVTFTPDNWDLPQSIWVMAADDAVFEGQHLAGITHAVSSPDAAYNAQAVASVVVRIDDRATRPGSGQLATAINHSAVTRCAEDDNVNIPIAARPAAGAHVVSYAIEATHPTYDIGQDITAADFTNAGPPTKSYPYENPFEKQVDVNADTKILVKREPQFWLPQAMSFTVNGNTETSVHYIALHRRIAGTGAFPQVLVIYSDGYVRLKPLPPAGRDDTVFGSSVIVGRAAIADRPYSEIRALSYDGATDSFHIEYANGDSGTLHIASVTRDALRVEVTLDVPQASSQPVATLRSMYVNAGNADMENVIWSDAAGPHNLQCMQFGSAQAQAFRFGRDARSRHNTSSPEIWIGDFALSEKTIPPLIKAPTASVRAATITRLGGKTYTFMVTYRSPLKLKAATIGDWDLEIKGPRGYRQRAKLVWRKPRGNSTTIQAKYIITAPGGTWDKPDKGLYTIFLRNRHVSDLSGNWAVAGKVGKFSVKLVSGKSSH